MGLAQHVVVTRARAPRDAAVQHYLEYLGSLDIRTLSSRGALDRLYSSRIYARKLHHPCVAYAPIDLDGQVGIAVDIPPEVYELDRFVVHVARCLYAERGGGFRHPLRA